MQLGRAIPPHPAPLPERGSCFVALGKGSPSSEYSQTGVADSLSFGERVRVRGNCTLNCIIRLRPAARHVGHEGAMTLHRFISDGGESFAWRGFHPEQPETVCRCPPFHVQEDAIPYRTPETRLTPFLNRQLGNRQSAILPFFAPLPLRCSSSHITHHVFTLRFLVTSKPQRLIILSSGTAKVGEICAFKTL